MAMLYHALCAQQTNASFLLSYFPIDKQRRLHFTGTAYIFLRTINIRHLPHKLIQIRPTALANPADKPQFSQTAEHHPCKVVSDPECLRSFTGGKLPVHPPVSQPGQLQPVFPTVDCPLPSIRSGTLSSLRFFLLPDFFAASRSSSTSSETTRRWKFGSPISLRIPYSSAKTSAGRWCLGLLRRADNTPSASTVRSHSCSQQGHTTVTGHTRSRLSNLAG